MPEFTQEQERVLRDVAARLAARNGYEPEDAMACVWLVARSRHRTYNKSRGEYRGWADRWVYRKARAILIDELRPVHVSDYRCSAGVRVGRVSLDDIPGPVCTESPAADIERASSRAVLIEAMSGLSPREQVVLARYYGLTGSEPELMPQIGAGLGVCPERIRQIREAALRKIRHRLQKMGCESSDL